MGRVRVASKENKVPPQAPAVGLSMLVNKGGLIDAEVRIDLAQMGQAITLQAQAMKDQVHRQEVQRENLPSHNMKTRL